MNFFLLYLSITKFDKNIVQLSELGPVPTGSFNRRSNIVETFVLTIATWQVNKRSRQPIGKLQLRAPMLG